MLPLFGNKEFHNIGYPTPDSIPDETACRTLIIPGSSAWLSLVMGCLLPLTDPDQWQQFEGGISVDDAAARASLMMDEAYANISEQCNTDIAPYWQDSNGDDLVGNPPDTGQDWYGILVDPDETFQANLENWFIGAFVAQIGGIPAAIEFLVIAKKFRLAWRTGDTGGVVNIFIDAYQVGTVDTYSTEPGIKYMDIIIPDD